MYLYSKVQDFVLLDYLILAHRVYLDVRFVVHMIMEKRVGQDGMNVIRIVNTILEIVGNEKKIQGCPDV